MSYNVSPTIYPSYIYPQQQAPVMGYPSAVQFPSQQMQNVPNSVQAGQPASSSNIQWVQGESSALAYPVAPGNTVILMDSDEPVVYKKSTDEHGKPLPMDVYDLVKRPLNSSTTPNIDLSEYMKKSDVEQYIKERLDKELDRRVSQLSFKPATRKKKSDDEYEED